MKTKQFSTFIRMSAFLMCLLLLSGCIGCKKSPKKTQSEYWLSYYEDDPNGASDGNQGTDSTGNTSGGKTNSGSTSSGSKTNSDKSGNNANSGSNGGDTTAFGSTAPQKSGGTILKRDNYSICSTGFPIVTNGTATLSVMLPANTYDTAASGFAKTYEKMTGVKVKYSYYKDSDIFTVKTTILKSGKHPDIFFTPPVGFTGGQLTQLAKEKVLVDLQPYLKTWGHEMNEAIKQCIYKDGKTLIGLPRVSIATGAENSKYCESQYYINQKWLKNLGLAVPKTTKELADVLDAFVNQDPDGNGQNDTAGLGLVSWRPQLWNPWGLNMSWYYMGSTDENGKSDWGPLTDQYREGILYYKDLWDRGLISKDVINSATETLKNKYLQKCGVMIGRVPNNVVSESHYNDWIAIATPVGSNTGSYKGGINESLGTTGAVKNGFGFSNIGVVFSSCKDVELAVRWLDYFYTQDGSMLNRYGPEGKAYKKTSTGYKLYKNVNTLKDGQYIGTFWVPGIANPNILERAKSEMTAQEIAGARYTEEYNTANRQPKYSFRNVSELKSYEDSKAMESWKLPNCDWGYKAIKGEVNIQTEWNAYVGKNAQGRKNLQNLFNNKLFHLAYK